MRRSYLYAADVHLLEPLEAVLARLAVRAPGRPPDNPQAATTHRSFIDRARVSRGGTIARVAAVHHRLSSWCIVGARGADAP